MTRTSRRSRRTTRVVVDPELDARVPGAATDRLEVVSQRRRDRCSTRASCEAPGEPDSAGWEDVVAAKVQRYLDPDAPLPLARPEPPATGAERSPDVRSNSCSPLLTYGVDQ